MKDENNGNEGLMNGVVLLIMKVK